MGPSGSGKSTLLNVIGLLDRSTAGRYSLDGRDVTDHDFEIAVRAVRDAGIRLPVHLEAIDFTDEEGTSVGTCEVASTGGQSEFASLSCPITETSGVHDLCLSFAGNSPFELDSWRLQ